jgi:hypothetical protein
MGTGTSNPPSAEEPVPIILGAINQERISVREELNASRNALLSLLQF